MGLLDGPGASPLTQQAAMEGASALAFATPTAKGTTPACAGSLITGLFAKGTLPAIISRIPDTLKAAAIARIPEVAAAAGPGGAMTAAAAEAEALGAASALANGAASLVLRLSLATGPSDAQKEQLEGCVVQVRRWLWGGRHLEQLHMHT